MKENSILPVGVPRESASQLTHDGGAVASRQWRILYVHTRSEFKSSELLASEGFETFVAYQDELHSWANKTRKWVKSIKIHNIVFVRAAAREREPILKLSTNFLSYMKDKAKSRDDYGRPVDAIISDSEIDRMRHILGQRDVPVDYIEQHYRKGDRVKILCGPFRDWEGECIRDADHCEVFFTIKGVTGAFQFSADPKDLQKL